MTTFDRIEPRLPELIDELAAARIPDYFDDMLLATAAAKQRPAWSSLERWLPMGEIARPLPTPQVPWRLLAVAAALVILAAGLVAYAGSRTRVPPPFGPAVNGSMFYDADGVIYAGDPTTGTAKAIVDGPTPFTYPLPSRDGRRIVYDHTELGTSQLLVADADGSNAHPLAGTYEGWTWTEWSPDGQRIGIVSRGINGRQAISILDVDGSAVETVPLDREVLTFWWLPDGGFVFTGAESPGDTCHDGASANRCALFVVGADGKDPRKLFGAPPRSAGSAPPCHPTARASSTSAGRTASLDACTSSTSPAGRRTRCRSTTSIHRRTRTSPSSHRTAVRSCSIDTRRIRRTTGRSSRAPAERPSTLVPSGPTAPRAPGRRPTGRPMGSR